MKRLAAFISIGSLALGNNLLAAEEEEHHLPHDHLALLVGVAYEEESDSHNEDGYVAGLEYIRQFHEHWGLGAAFEFNSFGGDTMKRQAVLVIPVSYFPAERWRLFAAPGIEFRDRREPDKAVLRVGAGYEFEIGRHMTFSPEFQIDFVSGGTKVYVFLLTFGYGF